MAGRGEHDKDCDFRLDMCETEPDEKPRVSTGENPEPATQPSFLEYEPPTSLGEPTGNPGKIRNVFDQLEYLCDPLEDSLLHSAGPGRHVADAVHPDEALIEAVNLLVRAQPGCQTHGPGAHVAVNPKLALGDLAHPSTRPGRFTSGPFAL